MYDLLVTILASAGVSAALAGGLLWLTRTWLSERLKNAIKHEYDQKLEAYKATLKAEHDRDIETLKAQLKAESDTALVRLTTDLQNVTAERDARRDYEYEARKRLYEEYEPLLFQLVELSEKAQYRVFSLARTARKGDLSVQGPFRAPDGNFFPVYDSKGWLSIPGYNMVSTIYELLAPLAIYKLMQRALTLVDLGVSPFITAQYNLAKILYLTLICDFEFASEDPIVEYTPNVKGWEEKRTQLPSRYWRQGLPLGRLDIAVEELLESRENKKFLKTFGEYENYVYNYSEREGNDQKIYLAPGFENVVDIFLGFHPKTRPILWRILVAQAHLHRLILNRNITSSECSLEEMLSNLPISNEERDKFDWRDTVDIQISDDKQTLDKIVFREPFSAAVNFVDRYLRRLTAHQAQVDVPVG